MKEQDDQRSFDRAELEKYRRVFYATPDYVTFSYLETGIFIDVNPGFEKLTGYRRAEVLGRSSASIDLWVDPAERKAAVELLKKSNKVELVTTRFRNRDGNVLLVEASLATFEMNGEAVLVGVVRTSPSASARSKSCSATGPSSNNWSGKERRNWSRRCGRSAHWPSMMN